MQEILDNLRRLADPDMDASSDVDMELRETVTAPKVAKAQPLTAATEVVKASTVPKRLGSTPSTSRSTFSRTTMFLPFPTPQEVMKANKERKKSKADAKAKADAAALAMREGKSSVSFR